MFYVYWQCNFVYLFNYSVHYSIDNLYKLVNSSDGRIVVCVSSLIIFRFSEWRWGRCSIQLVGLPGMTARPWWKSETLRGCFNNVNYVRRLQSIYSVSYLVQECQQQDVGPICIWAISRSKVKCWLRPTDGHGKLWLYDYTVVLACVPRHNSSKVMMDIMRQSESSLIQSHLSHTVTKTWGKNSYIVTVIPMSPKFKPHLPLVALVMSNKTMGTPAESLCRGCERVNPPGCVMKLYNVFRWNPCPSMCCMECCGFHGSCWFCI